MKTFCTHIQNCITTDCEKIYKHIVPADPSTDIAYIGAIVLDAIFPALFKHMEIIHTTAIDYAPKTEFDRLTYISKTLNFPIPKLYPIQKWQIFGNPSSRLEDFVNVARINDTDSPAQHRASIQRNQALHAHLSNIHTLLQVSKKALSVSDSSSVKGLFFFYILAHTFHLLDTHIFETYEGERIFLPIYKYFADEPIMSEANTPQKCSITSGTLWKELVVEDARSKLSLDVLESLSQFPSLWEESAALWDEMVQWKYISSFMASRELRQCIELLLSLFEKYGRESDSQKEEYIGNLEYIRDVYPIMMGESINDTETEEIFERNEYVAHHLYSTKEHRNLKLISESNHNLSRKDLKSEFDNNRLLLKKKSHDKDFLDINLLTMKNPFQSFDFQLHNPNKNNIPLHCPLQIYKLNNNNRKALLKTLKTSWIHISNNPEYDESKIAKNLDELFAISSNNFDKEGIEGIHPDIVDSMFSNVASLSIDDWKQFFRHFCNMKSTEMLPCLAPTKCEREEKERCFNNFLKHLRKIYICNMANP